MFRIPASAVAALLATAPALSRADGWVNARVPVAAHFGDPRTTVESGLQVDFLSVFPLGGPDVPEHVVRRFDYDRYRLGIGPFVGLRTLGLSNVGLEGGAEILALQPGKIAFGLGAQAGLGEWLVGPGRHELMARGSLSLQLRAAANGGTRFAQTTAAFVAFGQAFGSSAREVSAGLQFGGDPVSALLFYFWGGRW